MVRLTLAASAPSSSRLATCDPLAEVAGGDLAKARLDLGDRPDQRPREDVAETQRQHDAAERQADHDPPRHLIGLLARLDPLEHVGLGDVDELVGQALETIGERPRLAQLQLARLGDLAGAGELDHLGHDRDEAVVVLPDAAPADPTSSSATNCSRSRS